MAREFDLLGDPIPENRGKPGATGHVATAENVNKVRMLVLARWTSTQIAEEIGISVPTLNKHYFRNGSIKRARMVCVAEARGRLLLQLQKAADAGNVAAMKEIGKIADRSEMEFLSLSSKTPVHRKPVSVGKKEQRVRDARKLGPGDSGDGMVSFLPNYDSERPN